MTTSFLALPLSSPIPGAVKRKRVLLVDASPAKRELRAEAMRKLGVDVDCACDIGEARSWWRADLYNLVLINLENEMGHRDRFCDDMRSATPPQQMAFFVGKPVYLAEAPQADGLGLNGGHGEIVLQVESGAATAGDDLPALPQRWGIMEASRRISAVRSMSAARSNAIRNRPTPPRDLETRFSRRAEAEAQLMQLQKEGIL
jgi:CheY-like chemotaxis protein